MRRRGGFTLVEMLVVIIIITILTGSVVMMMNVFFRGQGVRQGAVLVMQALADARQLAAATRKVHFVVFSPLNQEGWLEIHEDMDGKGEYDGDQKSETNTDADKLVAGRRVDLPKFVQFEVAPGWIGIHPSGYIKLYDSGGNRYQDVQASSFDSIMNMETPNAIGDVVLVVQSQPYKMCLDLDMAAGKIRRQFFLAREN